ncbi:hypothetical protein C7S16_0414 [Burkholderia thailandensis]|uniref:Uncharacterized protein n=1 Tax=Burkholderia thailandensis TaxID=57975 RepID=A0AAW9CV94_BURTH|nr:hypothetical protein [Burkholderia thailandensis]
MRRLRGVSPRRSREVPGAGRSVLADAGRRFAGAAKGGDDGSFRGGRRAGDMSFAVRSLSLRTG